MTTCERIVGRSWQGACACVRCPTAFAVVALLSSLFFASPADAQEVATLTLTPDVAANIVSSEHCVLAHAEAPGVGGVGGASIVFSVSGPNAQDSTARTTDFDGDASFCYTGTQSGADTITAFADSDGSGTRQTTEPQDTATKHWLATQPQISLSPPSASNPINTRHTVTATVSDGSGPVAGANVFFSAAGTGQFFACDEDFDDADGFVRTHASGEASCSYTSEIAGLDTITAVADTNNNHTQDNGESSATATKRWTTASVTLTPSIAANIVGIQHCVSAHAEDAAGTPTVGTSIPFSVSGANPQDPSVRTTDAGGDARFCYLGSQSGTDEIAAFADNNADGMRQPEEPQGAATKRWLATQPEIALSPQSATNPIHASHTVTATVTDGGAPLAGVRVGFVIAGVHQFAQCEEPGRQSANFAGTDAQGQATCTWTSSVGGLDTVTAFADTNNDGVEDNNEPDASATKSWGTTVATLALTPSVGANIVRSQHCVDAHAEDAANQPVENAPIVFSRTGTNPTQSPTSVATDYLGTAQHCYFGSQTAGDDQITAFADNSADGTRQQTEPQDTATKHWLATQPPITLSPPSATNRINTRHTVTADVGVEGVNVVFRTGQFFGCDEDIEGLGRVRTNASGQASCTYFGLAAGLETITAFADTNNNFVLDNGENSATATKSWTTTEIATLTLTPAVGANIVGSQHCVTAHAEDASGLPVAAAPVVFSVAGVNAQDRTPTTFFCYTGTQSGTDTITAFADNNADGTRQPEEPQGTAIKRWLATQPQITLSPQSASNPLNTSHTVTATVTDGLAPIEGVRVGFLVEGVHQFAQCEEPGRQSASFALTDAQGQATCTWTGSVGGLDTVTAFADTDNNFFQDNGEPGASATKRWTGATGTIELKKQLRPTNDQGHFDLQIDGTTRASNAGHNTTTGAISVTTGTSHSVGEIAAAGTSLADYTSQISCTRNGAGAESGSGTSLANIAVGENDMVVCTIENTRTQPQGRLEVRKSLSPSTDPGRFDLLIDGQVLRASAGNNDATGEQTVGAGNHMVSEQAAAGTSLSRYTSSIVCRSGNGAGAIVASSQNAGPLTVEVAQSADVVCTIANTFKSPEGHPPNCSRVTADPNTLWPPNNKFQIVTLKGASDPDGDQFMIAITGVTQDEPRGRVPDARRVRALSQVELRAERLGHRDGRVYRIAFTVTDSTGLRCSGTVKVGVPHDRGSTARDSGGAFDSFGSSGAG